MKLLSDMDGNNITSLLLCFFMAFLPELLHAGKVYKAMPPAYLMDIKSLKRRSYNEREWLYDKGEYYHLVNTIIADNVEMGIETSSTSCDGQSMNPEVKKLSTKELYAWLTMNSAYLMELNNLGKKSASHIKIIETICFLKKKHKDPLAFANAVAEAFPEMVFNMAQCALIGAFEGDEFSLICDKIFDKDAARFMAEIERNEYGFVWYRNKKDKDSTLTRASIGEFLTATTNTFDVSIEQRFKGLTNPKVLTKLGELRRRAC